jgi:hypothetical protein
MTKENTRFANYCRDVFHSAAPYLVLAVIVLGTGNPIFGDGRSGGGPTGESVTGIRTTYAGGSYGAPAAILCALSSITSVAYRRFRLAYVLLVLATAVFLFRTATKYFPTLLWL